MRDYFEEMNIDYNELKRYEDIETYYVEVQDYTKLIKALRCDRAEALRQIVNKNREIERLNNIIKEVREYITYWHYRNDFRINSFTTGVKEELLEILDKENK